MDGGAVLLARATRGRRRPSLDARKEDNPTIFSLESLPILKRRERGIEEERIVKGLVILFVNYGLVASIFLGTAGVGVLAYRLEGSPWRWPLVALVLCGIGTIAGIFWIRRYVDRQTKASEQGSQQ